MISFHVCTETGLARPIFHDVSRRRQHSADLSDPRHRASIAAERRAADLNSGPRIDEPDPGHGSIGSPLAAIMEAGRLGGRRDLDGLQRATNFVKNIDPAIPMFIQNFVITVLAATIIPVIASRGSLLHINLLLQLTFVLDVLSALVVAVRAGRFLSMQSRVARTEEDSSTRQT